MAHDLIAMLERDEGRRRKAYPDPLTHGDPWTIGVGHTGKEVHEGLMWTDAQIDLQRDADIDEAISICRRLPWFSHVDEVRQGVLINMAFQMGHRLFTFHETLGAVRDEKYDYAALCMSNSLWAHQTPGRADRLMKQMRTGVWQY